MTTPAQNGERECCFAVLDLHERVQKLEHRSSEQQRRGLYHDELLHRLAPIGPGYVDLNRPPPGGHDFNAAGQCRNQECLQRSTDDPARCPRTLVNRS